MINLKESYIKQFKWTQYSKDDLPSQMGLLTGEQVYTLRFDSGDTLATTSAYYYDARGNLIVNKSKNHVGGYTKTYNEYNFTGGIVKSTTTHTDTIGDAITETYRYEYDHALRPTITYYQLNDANEVLLCKNSYDELGRLASQKYHNGLDSAKYAYNLHNQLTEQQKFAHSERLYYQNNPFGEGLYNGSLSAWSNDEEGYKFQYDHFNRLTVADNVTEGSNAFAEYFSYDKMGNILSLDRYDKEGELMDELAYSYVGHQLQKVEDKVETKISYEQQEYSGSGAFTRTYDAVGALTSDSSRGVVRIVNNLLALPDTIYFADGNRIVNRYDATGRKLESQWHVKRSISTFPLSSYLPETDKTTLFDTIMNVYDKNIEYSSGSTRISNPYGYIIFKNNDMKMYYNVTNYRGDIAGVYKVEGNKLQRVQKLNYYPSGVLWSTSTGQSAQPYKYGEKELIEISGLDMYDNLARYYEPAIGRANSIDPHCESYYSTSPYAWCGNNFVNIVDPTGMDTIDVVYKTESETWEIQNTQIVEGDDVVNVTDADGNTSSYTYSEGEYGKRVVALNLGEEGNLMAGVMHVSGAKNGTALYFVPGGEASLKKGSKKRVPDNIYDMIAGMGEYWKTSGILAGNPDRGIRFHYVGNLDKNLVPLEDNMLVTNGEWTQGCFVVCTKYFIENSKVYFNVQNSVNTYININVALGGNLIKYTTPKGKTRIGAKFYNNKIVDSFILKTR